MLRRKTNPYSYWQLKEHCFQLPSVSLFQNELLLLQGDQPQIINVVQTKSAAKLENSSVSVKNNVPYDSKILQMPLTQFKEESCNSSLCEKYYLKVTFRGQRSDCSLYVYNVVLPLLLPKYCIYVASEKYKIERKQSYRWL